MKRFMLFIATLLVASMSFAQMRPSMESFNVLGMNFPTEVKDTSYVIEVPVGTTEQAGMRIDVNVTSNTSNHLMPNTVNTPIINYYLTGDNQYFMGDRAQSVVTLTQFMNILDNYAETSVKNDKFYTQDANGEVYKVTIKRVKGVYHLYLCEKDYTKDDFTKIREDIYKTTMQFYRAGTAPNDVVNYDVDAEITKLMDGEPNTLFPVGVSGVMMSPMQRGGFMRRPMMMMMRPMPMMNRNVPFMAPPSNVTNKK